MVGDNGTESKYRGSAVLVMYALGALTAKRRRVSVCRHYCMKKVKTGDWVLARKESRRQEMRVQRN